MFVYRISNKEYIRDLSGTGAAIFGGRWNPKGLNMVYTAGNIALAYVEFLVHNYHILKTTRVCLAKIELRGPFSIKELNIEQLPPDWNNSAIHQAHTENIGKEFLLPGEKYMLKVPSAVVPGEFNYLLNPYHEAHNDSRIIHIIDPFEYDKRITGAGV